MNVKQATQDLLEMKDILDKLNIKFWLTHGTLLGAIRDKSFIETDRDMDIRILAKDWSPRICEAFIAMKFRCAPIRHYPPLITKLRLKKRVKTDLALEYYYPPDDIYICLTKNPDDPDNEELKKRIEKAKSDYLLYGRDTLGWAIYVFKKHSF